MLEQNVQQSCQTQAPLTNQGPLITTLGVIGILVPLLAVLGLCLSSNHLEEIREGKRDGNAKPQTILGRAICWGVVGAYVLSILVYMASGTGKEIFWVWALSIPGIAYFNYDAVARQYGLRK